MRAADNLDENDSKLTEFTAFQKRAQGAEQQNKNKQANSANTEIWEVSLRGKELCRTGSSFNKQF